MAKNNGASFAKWTALAYAGIISCAGISASSAMAATTDGSFGSTSTGTVDIVASVPARVRITGLTTIDLTGQDPTVAAADAQDVCVWSNTSTKGYTITATGDGTGSAFTLTDGSNTVPYSVEWSASSGASSGSTLIAGAASGSLLSTATNQNCSSGPAATASLIVKMSTADLGTMVGGSSYSGTLTLLVTPI